ncbi:transcription termination/antitermination factor NusG [Candidatus Fermentibacteria bacterium]|nr:MAG: transcription termination/antitermination factor NusG [Candidatus Fermentibacteria bacterium]
MTVDPFEKNDSDAAEVVAEPEEENVNFKWYVVHSFSGYEQRVAKFLEGQLLRRYPGRIGKTLIPTEEITHRKNGKEYTREKKLYPGYVFVQLEISDEIIMDIRAMSNVSGFPPMNRGKPVPLTSLDMKRIQGQTTGAADKKVVRIQFKVGQTVRVTDGPFRNFTGIVESINAERGKVKIIFTIFGRKAPVEIDYKQVRMV